MTRQLDINRNRTHLHIHLHIHITHQIHHVSAEVEADL